MIEHTVKILFNEISNWGSDQQQLINARNIFSLHFISFTRITYLVYLLTYVYVFCIPTFDIFKDILFTHKES